MRKLENITQLKKNIHMHCCIQIAFTLMTIISCSMFIIMMNSHMKSLWTHVFMHLDSSWWSRWYCRMWKKLVDMQSTVNVNENNRFAYVAFTLKHNIIKKPRICDFGHYNENDSSWSVIFMLIIKIRFLWCYG